jgi:predicted nucleic acid-binding protein
LSSPPGILVLDTNVISELMRSSPDETVQQWAGELPSDQVHTTAVTVAEVRLGIARLPAGRRRDLLQAAALDVFDTFSDRVLPFDADAARRYADVVTEREQVGTPISGFDAQIAAICRAQRAILVTRNTSDFTGLGLHLINPWLPRS